jgi:hypothetical protein
MHLITAYKGQKTGFFGYLQTVCNEKKGIKIRYSKFTGRENVRNVFLNFNRSDPEKGKDQAKKRIFDLVSGSFP